MNQKPNLNREYIAQNYIKYFPSYSNENLYLIHIYDNKDQKKDENKLE